MLNTKIYMKSKTLITMKTDCIMVKVTEMSVIEMGGLLRNDDDDVNVGEYDSHHRLHSNVHAYHSHHHYFLHQQYNPHHHRRLIPLLYSSSPTLHNDYNNIHVNVRDYCHVHHH